MKKTNRSHKTSIIYRFTSEKEEDLEEAGIYCISNKIDNRCYIGSTSVRGMYLIGGFAKRWRQHVFDLKHNKHSSQHLQNFVNKYGIDTLSFSIIEIIDDLNTIDSRENFWITAKNSYKNGFNMTPKTNKISFGKDHPRFIDINEVDVINKYKDEKLNIAQIASIYEVSTVKITSILLKHDITINNHLSNLPLKEIYYRHLLGCESISSLAKEFGVYESTINRNLKKFRFKNKIAILQEAMPFIKEYYNNGGSIVEYCKKLPYSHDSVYRRLKK